MVRFKVDQPGKWIEDDEDPDNEGHYEAAKATISPVTIWIGVFPNSTSATAAHDAAEVVLALLKDYQILDVDIEYRESVYTREAGITLFKPIENAELDPLVDFVSPLTPSLGLSISTKTRPDVQGTMALYLAEGGDRNRLLGLSCRHVLIGREEGNFDYARHPSGPAKEVIFFGRKDLANLETKITSTIEEHRILIEDWEDRIENLEEKANSANAMDAEDIKSTQKNFHRLVEGAEKEVKALEVLLNLIKKRIGQT